MTIKFDIDKASLKRQLQTMAKMSESQSESKAKSILRSAVKPILDDMKLRAPTADNDNILNNLGITTAKKRTKNAGGVRVGVVKDKTNMSKFSAPALAGSLEYGTVERVQADGGSTGSIKPRPFLRPAWDNNVTRVEATIEKAVIREVERAAK